MGERQTILSAAQTLPVCRHTHTLMCTHRMHLSFSLSSSVSLSFSQHHVTGCLLSFLILFIFHVSWMFCFSAPLPHLTSDDVDKALQNSPRLMHARNTGKQPCGPAPGPAHTAYTHTLSEMHAALRFPSSSACAADAEWDHTPLTLICVSGGASFIFPNTPVYPPDGSRGAGRADMSFDGRRSGWTQPASAAKGRSEAHVLHTLRRWCSRLTWVCVCVCVCSLVSQSPAVIMSKTEEQRAQLGESIVGTALTNWLYIHTA